MLLFNFILGLNYIFLCFVVWPNLIKIIMSLKQRKIKFKPSLKLNHNIHTRHHLFILSNVFTIWVHLVVDLHTFQQLTQQRSCNQNAHRKCTVHTFPYLSKPGRNFAKQDFIFPCMAFNRNLSFPVALKRSYSVIVRVSTYISLTILMKARSISSNIILIQHDVRLNWASCGRCITQSYLWPKIY